MTAAELYQFFKNNNKRWMSVKDIKARTGWRTRPLTRMLKKLSEFGFLDRKKTVLEHRSYYLYRK